MNKDLGYQPYSSLNFENEDCAEEATIEQAPSKDEGNDLFFNRANDLEEENDELVRENDALRRKNSSMEMKWKEVTKNIKKMKKGAHTKNVLHNQPEIEHTERAVLGRNTPLSQEWPNIKNGNQILLYKPILLIGNSSSMNSGMNNILKNWQDGDINV